MLRFARHGVQCGCHCRLCRRGHGLLRCRCCFKRCQRNIRCWRRLLWLLLQRLQHRCCLQHSWSWAACCQQLLQAVIKCGWAAITAAAAAIQSCLLQGSSGRSDGLLVSRRRAASCQAREGRQQCETLPELRQHLLGWQVCGRRPCRCLCARHRVQGRTEDCQLLRLWQRRHRLLGSVGRQRQGAWRARHYECRCSGRMRGRDVSQALLAQLHAIDSLARACRGNVSKKRERTLPTLQHTQLSCVAMRLPCRQAGWQAAPEGWLTRGNCPAEQCEVDGAAAAGIGS